MTWPKLRVHEWMFVGYFAYVAAISPLFHTRPRLHGQPVVAFLAVCAAFLIVDRLQRSRLWYGMDIARDWLPIPFIFLAFRELGRFCAKPVRLSHRNVVDSLGLDSAGRL